jgi:hypothetical protein
MVDLKSTSCYTITCQIKQDDAVNFEQLRLQMHMRGLYERLGAMDAELMIVDAFVKEQARHERIRQLKSETNNHADPA